MQRLEHDTAKPPIALMSKNDLILKHMFSFDTLTWMILLVLKTPRKIVPVV